MCVPEIGAIISALEASSVWYAREPSDSTTAALAVQIEAWLRADAEPPESWGTLRPNETPSAGAV